MPGFLHRLAEPLLSPPHPDRPPAALRIFGVLHGVAYAPMDNAGEYEFGQIKIDADLPPEIQARALLHEYGHGAFRSCVGANSRISEETFCQIFETAVAELVRQNPEAWKWILEGVLA